jgi:diguanylate cyclase (GGDEF)-like protein
VRVTDVVARLGGDEFGILMLGTDEEQARRSLERVAACLAEEVEARWGVGATFGSVTFTQWPEDAEEALRQADALMYEGKVAGRGRLLQTTWPATGREG